MCFRPPSFGDMMKTCPSCGAFNQPELEKCKKCGTELPAIEEASAPSAGGPGAGMPGPKGPAGPPKGPAGPPKGPAGPKSPAGPPKGPAAPKGPNA